MKWGLANDGMCLLCLASVCFFWLAVEHVIFQINVAIMHYFYRNNTCSVSDLRSTYPGEIECHYKCTAQNTEQSACKSGCEETTPTPGQGARIRCVLHCLMHISDSLFTRIFLPQGAQWGCD